jgi:hypothetical protein
VLLLVLILVLVAFGLLVVALLTGNVLCAWLSVAVSVAAAVVLVVDWLQRRSALKAGAAAGAAPTASTHIEALPFVEPDPVTEVLPVVPALAEPVGAKNTEDETRIDRPVDGQQTVIMPAVQPSGSAARPSGAEGPTTSSGGSPSPSVTEKPREPVAVESSRPVAESRGGDAEATVSVDIRKSGIDGRKRGSPVGDAPGEVAQAATGAEAATSSRKSETPADPPSTVSAATSAPPTPPSDSAPDGQAQDGSDAESPTSTVSAASGPHSDVSDDQTVVPTVSTVKGAESPDDRTQAEPASAEHTAGSADSETTVSTPPADAATAAPASVDSKSVDSKAETPAARGTAAQGAADRAASAGGQVDQPTRATFGGPASSGHELFDPVERSAAPASTPPPAPVTPPPPTTPPPPATPPQPPPGAVEETAVMNAAGSTRQVDESEPPEEPLDPAAARIVASLEDEVLVIDEEPRYHVASCRAVAAQTTIPLPAREAIELGFTPCGWCTPDAVLADRHRASARP